MILKPVQFIYDTLSDLKNFAYDRKIFKSTKLDIPVLSVGNLSVGGTGKTPCVLFIAQELLKIKPELKIAIVSRSYKASLYEPEKVDLTRPDCVQRYGDEPCLLQIRLPNCSVWSGPQKFRTAIYALKNQAIDFIIIDDGFSHRQLRRDLNIVLIDASVPLEEMQTLPVGRLREKISHLARADMIIITKCNLADSGKVNKLISLISDNSKFKKQNIFLAQSVADFKELKIQDKLFVFCGLGKPDSLKVMLESQGFMVQNFQKFSDHHVYSSDELDCLLKTYELEQIEHPELKLVTTEKDFVKLKGHRIEKRVNIVDYNIIISQGQKDLFLEKICNLIK